MAALRTGQPLTDEMSIVRKQAEEAIAEGGCSIRQEMRAYERWLSENDWYRYEIQHAMVCLNINATLASGTKMLIENKIGKA